MFFNRSSILKEVPYARLVETAPFNLPIKLDSDSKLHTEGGKLSVATDQADALPKNSISDSKLAVDYFNASAGDSATSPVNVMQFNEIL